MTKKLLLTFALLLTAVTGAFADYSGSCGDVSYSYVESTNTLTISGTGAMADYDYSKQPWYDYRSSIKTVVIGASVTTIGKNAFNGCSGLTSITIPASVTSIGERAFAVCSNLATVSFAVGSQLTTIGDYAFTSTGLTSIEIPASVTSIGERAFNNCSNLATISFAEGSQLTRIGDGAFNSCSGLTSITIPASVTRISGDAFCWCSKLETMTVEDGNAVYDSRNGCNAIIEKLTNTLIIGCKNSTIPDGVTTIGKWAFSDCEGLTSIEIPASVTTIAGYAFASTGLTSIEIPASVTTIGEFAFSNCQTLATVSFAAGSQLETIGGNAFQGCSGLTSITIPASVTSIGDIAFEFCSNLATVTVYAPSCTLGEDAFNYCENLTIYVFSDLVDDYQAADNWKNYKDRITEMEMDIPHGNCGENVRWVLTGEYPNYTLTISGTGAMADYEDPSDQPWKDYRSSIKTVVIGAGVTTIGKNAFNGCSGLTSITIPANVTSIGERAFAVCSNLATVSFAAGSQLASIGERAFGGCEGLTSIEIPASVTSIGKRAFNNCSNLATISFAAGSQLTRIGDGAFNSCSGLTSIVIPASVTSIGDEVFGWCSKLETMTVEDGNAVYDSRNGCNAIIEKSTNTLIIGCKNSTIPVGVTTIGEGVFSSCEGLTSIEIPASVTTIGEFAFSNCQTLATVSFAAGSQLETIGGNAFQGCSGLTSITIPASVTSIGDNAFEFCSNLATVTVYAPSCTLGEDAFNNCENLTIYVFSDLVDYYKSAWNAYEGIIRAMEMEIPNGKCGDVRWVLTGEYPNYTLTITGTGAMADYASSSDQPWKDNRSSIKTVVIGAGVTTIGKNAFNECSGLTSITIPANVTSIGRSAFNECSGLASVSFAAGSQLATIGIYAFASTGLTSIEIPASVTSIGEVAFAECSGLASVSFAAGSQLTTIGGYAFASTGLTSIEIPACVTSIGEYAFEGCSGLTTVSFAAGSQLTTIGNGVFSGCDVLTSITIPASVTSIGERAFEDCSGLTTVSFAAGSQLTTIGEGVFTYCSNLTSITIPASVTSIGELAFERCSNLATVTVYAPSCTLGVDAFKNCDNLTNIYVLSNYVGTYKSAWSAYEDIISVMFDGISTTTVSFDDDVTVNGVLYNRTFTASKPSTVMLPFSLGEGQTLTGGTLYKFTGVTKNETAGKWEATMTETATLQANTPYLLLPDENLVDGKVTFNLSNSTVTLNTKGGGGKETADEGSHWTFKGTYEYMKWTTETGDPDYNAERAAEIGYAYGFAGVAKTGIEVGDFVKVASGAKIRPMGCYLLWNDTPNASRAAARGAATEELPQSITVRLVGSNGETTAIGTLDTKTGEVTFDNEAWYTLDGVRLSGKPSSKGIYINNGKKVVIK